jgi:hypothetical protein
MCTNAKVRAKKRGLDFNLVPSDIIIPTHCPILGIPLFINRGGNSHTPNSPTLDRIDVRKGYVKGNVAVISMRANTIKSDATLEQVERLLVYMQSYQFHDNSLDSAQL